MCRHKVIGLWKRGTYGTRNVKNMTEDTYCYEWKLVTVRGYRQYGHSKGSPQYARAVFGGGGTLIQLVVWLNKPPWEAYQPCPYCDTNVLMKYLCCDLLNYHWRWLWIFVIILGITYFSLDALHSSNNLHIFMVSFSSKCRVLRLLQIRTYISFT